MITTKRKMPIQAKPGQLLSHHIEYDNQGDGATVSSMHEPEPGKKSDPWQPGPSAAKKSFGSRMEAHHHMAKEAGVNADIMNQAAARAHGAGDSSDGSAGPGESEGDDDEDQAESRGADPSAGAQASLSPAMAPKRKV